MVYVMGYVLTSETLKISLKGLVRSHRLNFAWPLRVIAGRASFSKFVRLTLAAHRTQFKL